MEHTLKLTDEQLGIVGAALAELPFKVAQPVMAAIQMQVQQAVAKAAPAETKAKRQSKP
jgi:hypothetical protein